MIKKHAGGRPRVSRHILIFERTDRPRLIRKGYILHIGLSLWEQIGNPRYVTIRTHGLGWRIEPAEEAQHDYTVLRYKQHNTPYLPLGALRAEELGLGAGRYAATVANNGIDF